jgi:hypothetical protein
MRLSLQPQARAMKKFETVLSDSADCNLTLYYDPEDPLSWIVKKWKKQLFWRRCEQALWFTTRADAERHAAKMIKECGRQSRLSQ